MRRHTPKPVRRTKTSAASRGERRSTCRILCVETLESRTLLSAGQLDPSFGYQGELAFTLNVASPGLIMYPDGGFLLKEDGRTLVRYTVNGQPDLSFGVDGGLEIPGDSPIYGGQNVASGVATELDGKLVVLVQPTDDVGTIIGNPLLYRLWPDGQVDTTFGTDGATSAIDINIGGR